MVSLMSHRKRLHQSYTGSDGRQNVVKWGRWRVARRTRGNGESLGLYRQEKLDHAAVLAAQHVQVRPGVPHAGSASRHDPVTLVILPVRVPVPFGDME